MKVGYGFDDERIGPEYAFAVYMDQMPEDRRPTSFADAREFLNHRLGIDGPEPVSRIDRRPAKLYYAILAQLAKSYGRPLSRAYYRLKQCL